MCRGHLKEERKYRRNTSDFPTPSAAMLSTDSTTNRRHRDCRKSKPEHQTTNALLDWPKYVVGMGCKRSKPQKIEALIDETLKTAGMKKSRFCIGFY